MDRNQLMGLLNDVRDGKTAPEEVLRQMQMQPFEDLGYANIDNHRGIRQGASEVIYGQGKTAGQILGIVERMHAQGEENILITRMSQRAAALVEKHHALTYHRIARVGVVNRKETEQPKGNIAVVSGGTSDMPVCEEAAITAEVLGNHVTRVYDVGVAGLHRLLSKMDILVNARVVVAVAGMEGALASVVGGLVSCPVIAVPTSVGYGANFGGVSALLSMLNSCASGVSVVNIDNGFGAGYLAGMINQMEGCK